MPDSGQSVTGGGRAPDTIPRQDPSELTTDQLLREIGHLRELVEGQVAALNARMDAQKELTEAQFRASTENVATAFTAAKEAVGKQDADTTKQLDRLADVIRTVEGSVAQRFEDLKGRMDRGEGKGAGFGAAGALIAGVIGVVGTLVGIGLSLFAFNKP
jgi:hypothetical protein